MEDEKNPRHIIASAFGLGYLPVCPGTWGSAGAVGFYVCLQMGLGWPLNAGLLAAALVVCLAVGIPLATSTERLEGRTDPGFFVLDEVAGQWVTCLIFWSAGWHLWQLAVACFIAFRVFDIAKPPPIRKVEKYPAGWGVMLDDLVAGLYGGVALWALRAWIWPIVF